MTKNNPENFRSRETGERHDQLRNRVHASVLKSKIEKWINEGKINYNNTISDLLAVCGVEEAYLDYNDYNDSDSKEIKTEIDVIRKQINWFQNEITSKNLSIKKIT